MAITNLTSLALEGGLGIGAHGSESFGASSTILVSGGTEAAPLRWVAANTLLNLTAWEVTGNTGLSSATNWLGTSDSVGVSIRTTNVQRMLIDSSGLITLGTTGDSATHILNGNLAAVGNSTASFASFLAASMSAYVKVGTPSADTWAFGKSSAAASVSISYSPSGTAAPGTGSEFFNITSAGLATLGLTGSGSTHIVNGSIAAVNLLGNSFTSNLSSATTYTRVGAPSSDSWAVGKSSASANLSITYAASGNAAPGVGSEFFNISSAGLATLGLTGSGSTHVVNGSMAFVNLLGNSFTSHLSSATTYLRTGTSGGDSYAIGKSSSSSHLSVTYSPSGNAAPAVGTAFLDIASDGTTIIGGTASAPVVQTVYGSELKVTNASSATSVSILPSSGFTVGSVGTATAQPAVPAGYFNWKNGSITVRVPFHN